ncbi:hypothetical protein V8C86DRAFT_3118451 [Haematococcus lacustris]
MLALCGTTCAVLADPDAVGPAGLAAEPASWLPSSNISVEAWFTTLFTVACQMYCISATATDDLLSILKHALCEGQAEHLPPVTERSDNCKPRSIWAVRGVLAQLKPDQTWTWQALGGSELAATLQDTSCMLEWLCGEGVDLSTLV